MLENYVPIDYSQWDFTGKGKNILHLLTPLEKKIWDTALPYQDSRKGETGHGEIVTYFTLKLSDFFPDANKEVTVMSAIGHDIGWSQLTQTERDLFYQEKDDGFGIAIYNRYEPLLRTRHQEQGVILFERLLDEIGYSNEESKKHVLEIISQHDTRKGFFSPEDGIMRDADKLYRFTLPEFRVHINQRGLTKEAIHKHRSSYFAEEGFFYSDISKEIAKIELDNTLKNLKDSSQHII